MLPRLFAVVVLLSAAACDAPAESGRTAQPGAAARPPAATPAPLSMGAGGY